MGRTLKRVPLDFDWPLGEKWEGYLNPYYRECTACTGRGYTPARDFVETMVGWIMWAYNPGREAIQRSHHTGGMISPDIMELTGALAGRAPRSGLGHDSSDAWAATKKLIAAAGLDPEVWGICQVCSGEGVDPAFAERYEAWEPTDPPAGDGYQMWETTSEGSPKSPVFATLDELAAWCADNATVFANFRATAQQWKEMLDHDTVHATEEGPDGTTMIFL